MSGINTFGTLYSEARKRATKQTKETNEFERLRQLKLLSKTKTSSLGEIKH